VMTAKDGSIVENETIQELDVEGDQDRGTSLLDGTRVKFQLTQVPWDCTAGGILTETLEEVRQPDQSNEEVGKGGGIFFEELYCI
jgi:hypothetical protein